MRGRDASAAASGARTGEGRSSVLVSEDKIRLELLAARHPAGRDHRLENIFQTEPRRENEDLEI